MKKEEMERKPPVGIENFSDIRREGFYYVDKTGLLKELLENWGKVNLFTRPRRFGKTLNMSMLRHFFEIGCDKSLFDGLAITKETELCGEYMGKFPIISISLKDVASASFLGARASICSVIANEALRFYHLMEDGRWNEAETERYRKLITFSADSTYEEFSMTDEVLHKSLRTLTELLRAYYGKQVILLIDEYDVPLAQANERGYYREMSDLIRNLFGAALKTNEALYFAVLTGCLRVAKESIFTGLNNFNVFSITDVNLDEYFGFTDGEVRGMLQYYGLEENYELVREWYDGYRFGNVDVYCPWDVICYCSKHRNNKKLPPQNYWINTSGNDIVKHFIDTMGGQKMVTKREIERLIDGETVQKEIRQELTYPELYASPEHIWSTLFMTGYLTQRGERDGNRFQLTIPNREVRDIFTEQILALFKEETAKDGAALDAFCQALAKGKPEDVEREFTAYLAKTISIRDTFARKPTKENFYHGILLGILGFKAGWTVTSNREAGDGFSDIMIWMDDADTGIIIEIKYAEQNLEEVCRRGLMQINEKQYAREFYRDGLERILKYAIACSRKKCRVMMEEENASDAHTTPF